MKKIFSMKRSLLVINLVIIMITMTVLNSYNIYAANSTMRNLSSLQITKEMAAGWNLGNSLDAKGGETAWGNPVTTKSMIDKIKAMGFNTVRIPVTFDGHFGSSPNYTIDSAWLNRVEQVVNYVLDNNMYAILNCHHEGSWLKTTYSGYEPSKAQLTKVWEQVSARFSNYGDYLIFETMNEPRLEGTPYEWTGGTSEARDVINKLNAVAVDTIRKSGGNNSQRHIMIPAHAACTVKEALDALIVPNNDSKVIISVHKYSPYSYAMDNTSSINTWGSDSDKTSLDSEFDDLYNRYIKNGRAVVVGEFGSINKNNESSRAVHAEYYNKAARTRGIATCWWDNGQSNPGSESFGIFNRTNLSWNFESIAKALVKGAGGTSSSTTTTTSPTVTPTATPKPTTTATSTVTPKPTTTATPTPTPTTIVTPTSTTNSTANYVITYAKQDWGSAGSVNITIKNNSSTEIKNWTLSFSFPGNQVISSPWGGKYTQSGSLVTITNLDYNSSIAAGGSTTIGFSISYSGSNATPTSFSLNGVKCSIQ